jgi:hypothetical protein
MEVKPAKKRKGVYKFVTREDCVYTTSLANINFENTWLSIEANGTVTVKGTNEQGYAWDGCTPKWNVLDLLLIGTPDGRVIVNTEKPITYYASLIHDILLQFRADIGISRKQADRLFLEYLGDFSLRYLYYIVVRGYGMLSDLWAKLF